MTSARIRVVGAGAMGRGIAQLAVAAGIDVELADARVDAVQEAVAFITRMLHRSAEKGAMTEHAAQQAISRLHICAGPTEPSNRVDIAIEAVVERLDVKQSLLSALEESTPQALLASNTSSLSITAIASALKDPSRLIGLHFFNPVPLMRLVEVVPGLQSTPGAVDTGIALVRRLGHHAIVARDTPGFIVNHVGRALPTEALAILSEGIASPDDIDRIARDTLGLKMGPFELMDLTGLDVSHTVMETIAAGFYWDPRLRPSPIAATRVAGKRFGRKTQHGFYRYDEGRQIQCDEQKIIPDPAARPLYVHANPDLRGILNASGVHVVDTPSADATSVVLPVGVPTHEAALDAGLDPADTIGIDPLSLGGPRWTVIIPMVLDRLRGNAALRSLSAAGRSITVTGDGPAPIAQRLVAAIVNLGAALAEHGIGHPDDIDSGARLGLGYPQGPLAMGDDYGTSMIVDVLDHMNERTRDPRYRASEWLRARATLTQSLLTVGTRPEDLSAGHLRIHTRKEH
ncbi:3-hydroxyacyl-CoA dehydrogenase [Prescottella equi]